MTSDRTASAHPLGKAAVAIGIVVCVASLPRVAIAIEAVRELSRANPTTLRFICFTPAPWVSAAFLLAHAWLAWAILHRLRGVALSWVTCGAILAIAMQSLTVFLLMSWLRWRGFRLDLF
jgi:hypothetical protein